MPVCSFFLWGLCTRPVCPYLHVSVGKDADICQDFVGGFCSLGDKVLFTGKHNNRVMWNDPLLVYKTACTRMSRVYKEWGVSTREEVSSEAQEKEMQN